MVLEDPIETMETDRLWAWPERLSVSPPVGHCIDPERPWEPEGIFTDRAERRWPRPVLAEGGGGGGGLAPSLARWFRVEARR